MAPSASSLKSVPDTQIPIDHTHDAGEVCPLCEQPISNEKLEEITKRAEAQERDLTLAITTTLQGEFDRVKMLDDAKAKEALEDARREGREALETERRAAAEKEATAREEGRTQATAAASEQVAQARQALEQLRASTADQLKQAAAEANDQVAQARQALEQLQALTADQLKQAAQEKAAAEERRDAANRELEQARTDGAAALEREKQQSADREAQARVDTARETATAAQEQFDSAKRAHQDLEAALNDRLAAAEAAKAAAEQAAAATKTELEAQLASLDQSVEGRLQELREALGKDKDAAVNAEKAVAFEANQKLSDKVNELQRALEKKTSDELGEGAEVDLIEALKEAFPDDKIERIHKGEPGADIRHVVVLNGKSCGKILYDSKNHKAWRTEFVSKLSADQLAEKADHAVLSVLKFRAGARHLDIRDGVIVANPARVVAVVQLLRRHLVDVHVRLLSNEERAQKTEELYAFLTSDRCAGMFARIDTHTDALLALQVKEKKAHEKMWKDQGILLASIHKVNAEIGHEIGTIIGTAAIKESSDE